MKDSTGFTVTVPVTVGAANAELLHFEATIRLHHFVEDPLHHVGVDQMAFGFNYFLERHELPVYLARNPE